MIATGWNAASAPSRTTRALLMVVGFAVLLCIAQPLVELPQKIGRSQNEGWNAFHAEAVTSDVTLYRDPADLVSNNYPPLSFAIVGGLAQLTGDPLRTGRAVALAALVVVAMSTGWIVSMITRSRAMAWLSGMLVVGSMGAHYPSYVAMNDPQMLGHAFQYVGLGLFLARGARRSVMVASMLLLLAGGLVKHNLIPVPLAITLWLFARRRRDFTVWVVTAVALTALSLVCLGLLFGKNFFSSLLTQSRAYGFQLPLLALQRWFVPIAPLLIGGFGVLLLPRRDARTDLILTIATVSLVTSVLTSAARGMSYNAIFDLLLALSILCGIALHEVALLVGNRADRAWILPAALGAVSLSLFLSTPLQAYHAYEAFCDRTSDEKVAREDLEFVRARSGSAMCEDPAVCYWAGKPFEVDLFNVGQKLASDGFDGSQLVERIARREFAVIQLDHPEGSPFLSGAMNGAILEHYALARTSRVNGYFYVPVTTSPGD